MMSCHRSSRNSKNNFYLQLLKSGFNRLMAQYVCGLIMETMGYALP